MFGLGPLEITLIALILLVLFGAKRIPLVIGAIGQGIRQFRSNVTSDELPSGDATSDARDGEDARGRGDARGHGHGDARDERGPET